MIRTRVSTRRTPDSDVTAMGGLSRLELGLGLDRLTTNEVASLTSRIRKGLPLVVSKPHIRKFGRGVLVTFWLGNLAEQKPCPIISIRGIEGMGKKDKKSWFARQFPVLDFETWGPRGEPNFVSSALGFI